MIAEFWNSLDGTIRPAIISALATILSATIAALVVMVQIGRQAAKARENIRHTEEIKLKLSIYEKILRVCEVTQEKELEYANYVRMFAANVRSAQVLQKQGVPWTIPDQRILLLNAKAHEARMTFIDVIIAVEQWGIVDPRMTVFKFAINAGLFDLNQAHSRYFEFCLKLYPVPLQQEPHKTFPWLPPDDPTILLLQAVTDEVTDALGTLGAYLSDFRTEMQQYLLRPLFPKNTLEVRDPIDPRYRVIRLDQWKSLSDYFENESPWGVDAKRIKADARDTYERAVKSLSER